MALSRWDLVAPIQTEAGVVGLPERVPLAFRERADNRTHVVEDGDSLAILAARYLAPLPRACGYWWALAEFQVPPVVDPTEALVRGRVLAIPAVELVRAAMEGR